MDKNTGEDGAVVADLKKYNEEAAKLLVPPPASPGQPSVPAVGPPGSSPSVPAPAPAAQPTTRSFVYWGEALCSSCHKEQAAFWKKTPHATAIDVLRRRSRVMDVQCIGCHTTGFKRPGGFDVAAKMFGYENVQCEACHGPGLEHGKGMMAATARSRETCVGCHNEERSPSRTTARSSTSRPCCRW
ncbi:MAG: cytochrome c family protein [Candidatus Riflebacteria bacterium]|nr:cytochrome c family protein [Candidatus Riflebacteria bacterium]